MEITTLLAQAPELIDRNAWPTGLKIAWILHIIGVILWIGGLMFLTRLLGYHMKEVGKPDSASAQATLTRIELRLHHFVIVPGAILALVGGVWMLAEQIHYMKEGWFHAKLTIVLFFIILHVVCLIKVLGLAANPPEKKSPIFSIIHGISGLLLIAVLILLRFRF
jgi:putative membrane protein